MNSYLYWRNFYLNSGAETLGRLLLLWCCFLPMSRYWSIDGALSTEPRSRPTPLLPFIALRIQISSLYLFAGLFKIAGAPWRDGSGLRWALSDDVFGATTTSIFVIRAFPGLLIIVNYLVIGFQLAFPLLIYSPYQNSITRAVALTGSTLMHTSFLLFMNIGGFPYVCCLMLILLVPDTWIEHVLKRRRHRLAAVTIYHEPGCGFCRRLSLIIREFLLCNTSRVVPSSNDVEAHRLLVEHNSWVIRAGGDQFYLKSAALRYILSQHPLLFPAVKLFDRDYLESCFDRVYDLIGRHRGSFAPIVRFLFPYRPFGYLRAPALVLCGVLMTMSFISNISGLARLKYPAVAALDQLTAVLQIKQSWEIFAPMPTHFRWRYRVTAYYVDDSVIDLTKNLPGFRDTSGASNWVPTANSRWMKYFTRLDELTDAGWRGLGDYLCRRAMRMSNVPAIMDFSLATTPVDGAPPARKPQIRRNILCDLQVLQNSVFAIPSSVPLEEPPVSGKLPPGWIGTFGGAGRRTWLDTDSDLRIG